MCPTGCQRATKDNQAGLLKLALRERVRSLDPALSEDTLSATIIAQVYEPPLQYRYNTDKFDVLEPLLLTELPSLSADQKVYTLKIRKQVKFQDDKCFGSPVSEGRELHAKDFVLSILRLLDPAVRSNGFWTFANRLQGDEAFVKAVSNTPFTSWKARLKLYEKFPITGLEIVDAKTLKIKFKQPYYEFPYILAMLFVAPVPEEALLHYGDDFGSHAVGTGPYMVDSWRRNSRLMLKRNKDYWGGTPDVKAVNFEFILESQPYWLKFTKGKIDLASIPKDYYSAAIDDNKQLKESMKQKGIRLLTSSMPVLWYIGFNMRDPIIGNDPLLREAIAYAYNYTRRLEQMTNNRGIRATTIIPPMLSGHQETSTKPIKRNIAKARNLLYRSRYARMENPPTLSFDLRGSSTTNRQWGEFFARDMAELGIKVKINLNSFAEYIEKEKAGRLQIFMGGWAADYPDPLNFLQLLYGPNASPGPNATFYNNQEFNGHFEKAQLVGNAFDRMRLIQKMVALVKRDRPWIEDFFSTRFTLIQPWISGYQSHPFAYNYIKYLKLDNAMRSKRSLGR